MNFFQLFNDLFINFIFQNRENYIAFIGNLENYQQQTISFIIDFLSFAIPLVIILSIFIIPMYFLIKAFNGVIKNFRTNATTEDFYEKRTKRKKR